MWLNVTLTLPSSEKIRLLGAMPSATNVISRHRLCKDAPSMCCDTIRQLLLLQLNKRFSSCTVYHCHLLFQIMPKRGSIALVACERCRARKIRVSMAAVKPRRSASESRK